jgi:hypothetical protein
MDISMTQEERIEALAKTSVIIEEGFKEKYKMGDTWNFVDCTDPDTLKAFFRYTMEVCYIPMQKMNNELRDAIESVGYVKED